MNPTNRAWAVMGMAGFLAVFSVILAQPAVFVGSLLLGVWLLGRQYLFVRSVTQFEESATIRQQPSPTVAYAKETVPVTIGVSQKLSTRLEGEFSPGFPPGATGETDRRLSIPADADTVEDTVTVSWPVAGRHQFSEATVTLTDGLFSQSIPLGEQPVVTVEQRSPDQLHVGQGGTERSLVYGEHTTDRKGPGIEPAELRAYIPGDTVEQIDWNATARLNEPYVREFEVKSDRQTILIFDHRESLAEGPPGESKLEYLRAAGLAITEYAASLDDPLGLVTVGESGLTRDISPSTRADQYETVREALLSLTPTTPSETMRVPLGEDPATTQSRTLVNRRANAALSLQKRQRVSTLLAQQETNPFTETLTPFFERQPRYIQQIDDQPLLGAVETATYTRAGHGLTVLCTDDSNRVEIVEAVRRATHDGGAVLVLLTPSVLFAPVSAQTADEHYREYLDFEEFRQELDSRDAVTALEIAPQKEIETILSKNRTRPPIPGGGQV